MFTIDELNLANQELKTIHITKSLDELYVLANSKKAWTDYEKTLIRNYLSNGYELFLFALFKNRPRYFDLLQIYAELETMRIRQRDMKVRERGYSLATIASVFIVIGYLVGRCH